jgi:pilus assembly protein CpaE
MAQITALINTTDPEFRTYVTRLLRSSGISVGLIDERHAGGTPPGLAIVDIRSGSTKAVDAIERLRASWPGAAIFAIAATAEPDQILQAMRGGANEYLAWTRTGDGPPLEETFVNALQRTVERIRSKDGARSSAVLTFFGAKGGAGTTTLAVNSAIDIARVSRKPTLIIDLHQFLGEVSLFLGVRPRFTLVDALDNLHRLDQEFLRELVVKHKTGLDILAGGENIDRPGPQDAPLFEQLLQILGRTYDYIVVDAGIMTGPCTDVAVYASDTVYLVANPDVACIRNTHRMLDRMAQLGAGKDRLRVLLNRMSDQHQIGQKQIETTLGQSLHMVFPSDYGVVSSALNSGVPLTLSNHSELAAQFASFTKQIVHPGKGHATAASDDAPRGRSPFLGIF